MKILYARTHFWFNLKAGGSVGHTAGVLNGFAQMANVAIISNDQLPGVANLSCVIVPPKGPIRGWVGEFFYNFYFAPHLVKKIEQFRPDFVYHRYSGYSFAVAQVCKRMGVPMVLEFNSSDLWKLRYWTRNDLKQRITRPVQHTILTYSEPYNLQAANLVVVVSAPLKEGLLKADILPEKVLVNPNAVDIEHFRPVSHEVMHILRQKLGIPGDKILLGFIGTFGPWHGAEVLAEAFGCLLQEYPQYRDHVRLFLIGDGVRMAETKANLAKYEVLDACLFSGLIPQALAPEYLGVCDILVSPHVPNPDGTPFFGSPTKLFEYMAMGKGIVASNLDQIGEVLEHGQTAWLVKPGDVTALKDGLEILIADRQLCQRLGENARREVMKNHTWFVHTQKIIDKFIDLQ